MSQFFKKLPKSSFGGGQQELLRDEEFYKQWPALHEYMALQITDDGQRREPSPFRCRFKPGRVVVQLDDVDQAITCTFEGETFRAALTALDAALRTGKVNWESASWLTKKKGKK